MGLFGKKKVEEINRDNIEPVIEPITNNSEDLINLKNEFNGMRDSQSGYEPYEEVEEEIIEDEYHGGEEYEVSEDESAYIESFLSAPDEEIEEDVMEEETISEEPYMEGELDTSSYMSRYAAPEEDSEEQIEEEPVDVEINIEEVPVQQNEEVEEDILEQPAEEDIEEEIDSFDEEIEYVDEVEDGETSEIVSEDEQVEEVVESAPPVQEKSDYVTSADIDKKFDDFEKRLLEKLMNTMAMMAPTQVQEKPSLTSTKKEEPKPVVDSEDVVVEYDNGILVIDGYKFQGEVVMFSPLDNIKKATWEEVVRRKGHCTYHLTSSGNGGFFIKKSNAPNPYAYIQLKEDAVNLAKAYAKKEKAELKVHNAKGVIEQSLSFGREKLRG